MVRTCSSRDSGGSGDGEETAPQASVQRHAGWDGRSNLGFRAVSRSCQAVTRIPFVVFASVSVSVWRIWQAAETRFCSFTGKERRSNCALLHGGWQREPISLSSRFSVSPCYHLFSPPHTHLPVMALFEAESSMGHFWNTHVGAISASPTQHTPNTVGNPCTIAMPIAGDPLDTSCYCVLRPSRAQQRTWPAESQLTTMLTLDAR